jgi:hypothetical protein
MDGEEAMHISLLNTARRIGAASTNSVSSSGRLNFVTTDAGCIHKCNIPIDVIEAADIALCKHVEPYFSSLLPIPCSDKLSFRFDSAGVLHAANN